MAISRALFPGLSPASTELYLNSEKTNKSPKPSSIKAGRNWVVRYFLEKLICDKNRHTKRLPPSISPKSHPRAFCSPPAVLSASPLSIFGQLPFSQINLQFFYILPHLFTVYKRNSKET